MKSFRRIAGLLLAAAMLLSGLTALADAEITVTGSGAVYVQADIATITLGVSASGSDVQALQSQVNGQIAAIREALLGAGISDDDISTDRISVYSIYSGTDDRQYTAESTLAIRTTDMDSVGTLIDLSFGAGANTLNGISFSAADTQQAEDDALRAAVADARHNAEVMAEAGGLTLKGIESMTCGSSYTWQASAASFARDAVMAESASPTVVDAATVCVSADVTVTYEAE